MGERGPIGKRDEDRVRRNATSETGVETTEFILEAEVKIPPKTFIHPTIQGLWLAIKKSVNVKYYEPSDWWYAILTLEIWDDILSAGKRPGAMELSALDSMLGKMLITEADRRRVKIEAKRGTPDAQKVEQGASAYYKEQFEKQAMLRVVPD